jgi:hypothetical protein
MFWLSNITRTQLQIVTSYVSTADRIWAVKFGPQNELKFACACSERFESKARLATHQWSSHGLTNPIRQLVTSNICPLCKVTFKDIKQAKNHAQIICAPKRNPTIVAALLKAAEDENKNNPNTKNKKYKINIDKNQQRQHTIMSSLNVSSTYKQPTTPNTTAIETTSSSSTSTALIPQTIPTTPNATTINQTETISNKLVASPTQTQKSKPQSNTHSTYSLQQNTTNKTAHSHQQEQETQRQPHHPLQAPL